MTEFEAVHKSFFRAIDPDRGLRNSGRLCAFFQGQVDLIRNKIRKLMECQGGAQAEHCFGRADRDQGLVLTGLAFDHGPFPSAGGIVCEADDHPGENADKHREPDPSDGLEVVGKDPSERDADSPHCDDGDDGGWDGMPGTVDHSVADEHYGEDDIGDSDDMEIVNSDLDYGGVIEERSEEDLRDGQDQDGDE